MRERLTNFVHELNDAEILALRAENSRLRDDITRLKVSEAAYGAENDRLREAIRRLADQDATLSVVGGNVDRGDGFQVTQHAAGRDSWLLFGW